MGAHEMSYIPNTAELEFIRKSYNHCAAFLTICGGVIPASMAGVLKGKTCTAPQVMLGMMRKQSPDTNWVEKRYAQDEKVWTSGALLNGLDMMRAFVIQTWGNEGAGSIAQFLLQLGHFPTRDVDYKDAPSTL
jgi:transcriptional regulator GlxA family with amidase domain